MTSRPPSAYGGHFDRLATRYDELRGEGARQSLSTMVRLGDLAGRRVLDVACGTGRTAAALAAEHGATVTAVDGSPEMAGVARERAPEGVTVIQARAEALPFADAAFERVTMEEAVHLVDRARALPELARVLEPGGLAAVRTVDPAGCERFWLAPLFPSYVAIDSARFPPPALLADELVAAGFESARAEPSPLVLRYPRERALELLHGRFASSFALMDEAEVGAGIERAERELPEVVETTLELVILVAER